MKDIITIDGPSGAGKSTVSKLLAQKLGYKYLDTGALYRAVAWKIKEENGDPEDEKTLDHIIENIKITLNDDRVMVNGMDVTSKIRTPEIGELSSQVSALPIAREFLYTIQKEIGLKGNIVIEGRDIGSAIFPEAKHKFFLDASAEERGRRRLKELKQRNLETNLETTIEDIKTRDKRDSTRQASPLKRTKDMNYIDTTTLTLEEVVTKIMEALKTP